MIGRRPGDSMTIFSMLQLWFMISPALRELEKVVYLRSSLVFNFLRLSSIIIKTIKTMTEETATQTREYIRDHKKKHLYNHHEYEY